MTCTFSWYGPATCLWNTSCTLTRKRLVQGLEMTVYLSVGSEEEKAMAEQRTPGSGGTSPAPERGSQGRDTTQEVSTQITETARHVGETASQYYEQGRQQLEGLEQSLEENIRAKPLQSVLLATGIGLLLGLLWRK